MTQVDVAPPAAPAGARPAAPTLDRYRYLAVLAAIVVVGAYAIWLISPRFEIDLPSLVDDWASLSRSSDQVAALLRLENPEEQRFVPALFVWNYLQWHTFDAPAGLVGPNAWGILRTLILFAGLSLLTAVVLPRRRGGWNAVLDAALVAIPAFAVVTVPKFARDIARFGPQEPLLIGGMALGGALLILAFRRLLSTPAVSRWTTAAVALAGSVFWLLGTYHKETSVAALPLVLGFALAGREQVRAAWPRLERPRRVAAAALVGVVALPLLHVAAATALISARGDLIYGAEVGAGRGFLDGFLDLYDWAHEPLPDNARLFVVAAFVLTGVAAAVTRRLDAIALGALLSGVLSLAAAGQAGVLATRYYTPAYALFGLAFAISLARLPTLAQVAGVLCVFFAFTPTPGTRAEVAAWTDEEMAGAAVVRQVRDLEGSGCRIALDAVDPETTVALPVLVALEPASGAAACPTGGAYVLLGPGGTDTPLGRACAEPLVTVVESPLVTLYRCDRLAPEGERLVRLHRLEAPGG